MTKARVLYTVCAFAGLSAMLSAALAQPSINPPPGPITESARFGLGTALNATNTPGDADSHFQISDPGMYYLTENLTTSNDGSAIEVTADSVVIDLNGFTLTAAPGFFGSPPDTDYGITVATTNVVIRNGTVRLFRLIGINAEAGTAVRVENIQALQNGDPTFKVSLGIGIAVGPGGAVVRCTAYGNTSTGILAVAGASVIDSVAYENDGVGISASDALVANCSAFNNTGPNIDIGATSSTLVGNHAP